MLNITRACATGASGEGPGHLGSSSSNQSGAGVYFASDAVIAVQVTFLLVFYCCSTALNVLLLAVVLRAEALQWQPRYILLCNLSACDLMFTTTLIPQAIHSLSRRRYVSPGLMCQTSILVSFGTLFCILLNLSFMALDRYFYICRPMHYMATFTSRRTKAMVLGMWSLSLAVSLTYVWLLGQHGSYSEVLSGGVVCEPDILEKYTSFPRAPVLFRKCLAGAWLAFAMCALAFSYTRIYRQARLAVEPFNQTNERARTTVLLHGAQLSLYLGPLVIKFSLDILLDQGVIQADFFTLLDAISLSIMVTIPPCVNPVVYGLRNEEIWRALKAALCRRHQPVMTVAA
ncbi:olfactory receptor 1571-like [Lampetra fluviatilis]